MNRRHFVGLTRAGVSWLLAEQRAEAALAAFAFGYIKALIAAVSAET
jgi:hypothetical protein